MKKYTFVLSGELHTTLLGAILASVCIKGCIIYLYGDVGVGKSVFCKGFLRKLGYAGYVNSPTYTLVESYIVNDWYIYHFDFYRVNSAEELENIGFRDFFDGNAVCLIEWPKPNIKIFPAEDISVTIDYCDAHVDSRKMALNFFSDIGQNMLQSALPCWDIFK